MTSLSADAAADLFRREPDRHLDVGEGSAAYWKVGSGPDVLFVHGWPVSGATWRKLLPHLADHVTCHLFDFPSAGQSHFDGSTTLSVDQHIATVGRVVDALGLDDVAVVGHDSGGLIARHAMVGHAALRAMGLVNTEPPDPSWRFRSFIRLGMVPGLGALLGQVARRRRLRKSRLVFGDAFVDRSLLDGEFDEFFFEPLRNSASHREAAARVLRTFEQRHLAELPDIHARIDVPVQLVWGEADPFFPVERARAMVGQFPRADITVIEQSGLFSHEETPEAVAAALLPTLAR